MFDNAAFDRRVALAWCPLADAGEAIITDRNLALGFWAGRALGLSGAALERYAGDVALAGYVEGEEALAARVAQDFAAEGIGISAQAVRARLREEHITAALQTLATD